MRPAGDGATRRIAAVHRYEISDALLRLITRTDIPAPAIAAAGWLLSQMVPGACAAAAAAAAAAVSNGVAVNGVLLRNLQLKVLQSNSNGIAVFCHRK
jgi:hypothetical protein